MATYIVGDVQGCFASFQVLLKAIKFRDGRDQVYFLGDLINRGPDSLRVLRWAVDRDAISVLGNHDLYCLAAYAGVKRKGDDTLSQVLEAHDVDLLMNWLRYSPLVLSLPGHLLVHAGFDPRWSLSVVKRRAEAVEDRLRGPHWREFVRDCMKHRGTGNAPEAWLNSLTRIRMCGPKGAPDFGFKGRVDSAPTRLRPWYERSPVPRRRLQVLFGHWAALGIRRLNGAIALDGGCVWGGELAAYCLENDRIYSVPAAPGDIYRRVS